MQKTLLNRRRRRRHRRLCVIYALILADEPIVSQAGLSEYAMCALLSPWKSTVLAITPGVKVKS